MSDLMKLDLYELLDINVAADEKEVRKAYRKKALSCHPDKNPDNPKAAELFQQLSKALEVLTDSAARSAYDKVLHARKAAKIRHRELDSKRKKLKEDLEARERAANEVVEDKKNAAEKLQKEIERLRREGSKLLEEELERMRQEVKKDVPVSQPEKTETHPRLKVKWKSQKDDETNGGYDKEKLEDVFKKYGNTTCLVSAKKKGSAIVEFDNSESAERAFETERGDPSNPFHLSWISGQPEVPRNAPPLQNRSPAPQPGQDSALTDRDYESLVLMRLRQAEERKRLIQQMMEED